jgi:hypothetical protein
MGLCDVGEVAAALAVSNGAEVFADIDGRLGFGALL